MNFKSGLLAQEAQSPIDDLGLIDLEPAMQNGFQARSVAYCALDIGRLSTQSAYRVVMIITHSRLEQRRMSRGLNSTNEANFYQGFEIIVNCLC